MVVESQSDVASIVVVSGTAFAVRLQAIVTGTFESADLHAFRSVFDARAVHAPESIRLVLLDTDAVSRASLRRAIRNLASRFPRASFIVADERGGRQQILDCLAWGAHGVIFKDQPRDEIARALRLVLRGGISIPLVTVELSDSVHSDRLTATGAAPLVADAANDSSDPQLTPRQHEVLELLVQGLANKSIARELGISEATVKVHINAVFKALEVNNRASAVARALSDSPRWLNGKIG